MKTRTLIFSLFILLAATVAEARKSREVQPLLVGMQAPKVSVTDESGTIQYLPALLKGKKTVLVFYRGGWCPYCSKQLQALNDAESELLELGYQIIAISPDSPENLSSIEKDGELNYTLYSDSSLEVAAAFGIDYTLNKATLLKYKTFGINLAKSSGGLNKKNLLVPSVFLITPDNYISFTHVDPDYRFRISSELLIAAAKDSLSFHKE